MAITLICRSSICTLWKVSGKPQCCSSVFSCYWPRRRPRGNIPRPRPDVQKVHSCRANKGTLISKEQRQRAKIESSPCRGIAVVFVPELASLGETVLLSCDACIPAPGTFTPCCSPADATFLNLNGKLVVEEHPSLFLRSGPSRRYSICPRTSSQAQVYWQ
jgi:hypothetical protein